MNFEESVVSLELRQYKNNSTQSKNFPLLKLPRFFTGHTGDKKEQQFQNKKVFD